VDRGEQPAKRETAAPATLAALSRLSSPPRRKAKGGGAESAQLWKETTWTPPNEARRAIADAASFSGRATSPRPPQTRAALDEPLYVDTRVAGFPLLDLPPPRPRNVIEGILIGLFFFVKRVQT